MGTVVSFTERLLEKRSESLFTNSEGDWVKMPVNLPEQQVFTISQIDMLKFQLQVLKLSAEHDLVKDLLEELQAGGQKAVSLAGRWPLLNLAQRLSVPWVQEQMRATGERGAA